MMDGDVGRLMQTLGHLTDVEHLQHTSLATERAEVDLDALLEDVQLDMQPELRADGAQLTLDLGQAPAAVLVAPKVLRSMVYSLLNNAVKYRAPDRPPVVLVRAAQAGPRLVLTIQANGLGLTKAQ